MIYGTGYIQSELDGTEHQVDIDLFEVPKEISYRDSMPPVENQGYTSKCVCYSLAGILDWKVNRLDADSFTGSNHFDKDELYSIRARKDLAGMQIKEALKYLKHHGLSSDKGNVTISQYAIVNSRSAEVMKRCLVAYGPIVIGLPVYNTSGFDFWNGAQFAGGHAVCIIGYNENGFLIRNSWGQNWGWAGHVILPFDDIDKILEAWVVI